MVSHLLLGIWLPILAYFGSRNLSLPLIYSSHNVPTHCMLSFISPNSKLIPRFNRFGLRCMFPTWSDWDITYTSRGLAKKRFNLFLRILALVGTVSAIIRLRRSGMDRAGVKELLKGYVRTSLLTGAGVLQLISNKI
jgi:hypothetical protein